MTKAYLQLLIKKYYTKNNGKMLQYRHKSGKLYACSVCKSFKSPTELNTDFHVGKVKENGKILSVDKWDMAYPNEITELKNQVERGQVALCGLFSNIVKDAKMHQ